MFLCASTKKNKMIRTRSSGNRGSVGIRSRLFFFSIQWTSLVWLPGVRTAAPYVLSFSDQHVQLLYHQHSLSCQDPRERNTGTGARERGGEREGREVTAEFSRIEKDCNAKEKKGRGVAVKFRVLKVPSRTSFFLASWSRFGSTPRDNREILLRKGGSGGLVMGEGRTV
jgi:hypothetical protein